MKILLRYRSMFLFDDYEKRLRHILNANGVVLVAPDYIYSVLDPMKDLFDRLSDAIHCQMLTEKVGFSVYTAEGSGDDEVLKCVK